MSDERPKKSWKEIDRARDGSGGRREPAPRGPGRGQRSQKSYRAALDRAFNSGKIGNLVAEKDAETSTEPKSDKKRLELARAVLDADDRNSITKAVDAYMAEYPLADDADLLAKAVQHKKPGPQIDAMERLLALLPDQKPKRVRALVGHLKLLRDTADDREIEDLADKLLDQLD
jgi:hypothetical protein